MEQLNSFPVSPDLRSLFFIFKDCEFLEHFSHTQVRFYKDELPLSLA